MNANDPIPSKSLMGFNGTAGLVSGGPMAVATVWYLQTFVTHGPIDSLAATAIGSIGSTVFGFLWHLFTTLAERAINKE